MTDQTPCVISHSPFNNRRHLNRFLINTSTIECKRCLTAMQPILLGQKPKIRNIDERAIIDLPPSSYTRYASLIDRTGFFLFLQKIISFFTKSK